MNLLGILALLVAIGLGVRLALLELEGVPVGPRRTVVTWTLIVLALVLMVYEFSDALR